jgi:hypothetical protein
MGDGKAELPPPVAAAVGTGRAMRVGSCDQKLTKPGRPS